MATSANAYRELITTLILAAAWADGSVCDSEKQALQRIMLHLGYLPDEVSQRLAGDLVNPDLEKIPFPEDPCLRLEIVRYAMAVTMADGSLEPSEIDFLLRLTEHLGLSSQTLAILKLEADQLVEQGGAPGPASIVPRVEALLPESS
jgi:uncharacterized tellurite resistance protein B-like protein